jgi:hypothetical protein
MERGSIPTSGSQFEGLGERRLYQQKKVQPMMAKPPMQLNITAQTYPPVRVSALRSPGVECVLGSMVAVRIFVYEYEIVGMSVYEYEMASVQEYDVTTVVGPGAQVLAGWVRTGVAGSNHTGAGSDQAGADSRWRACTVDPTAASCRGVELVAELVAVIGSEIDANMDVEDEVEKATGAARTVEARRSARAKIRNNIIKEDVEIVVENGANRVAEMSVMVRASEPCVFALLCDEAVVSCCVALLCDGMPDYCVGQASFVGGGLALWVWGVDIMLCIRGVCECTVLGLWVDNVD